MVRVIPVGGLGKWATAGVLMAAGAAFNRLFRPFDAAVSRPERVAEPLLLTFPISPRQPLDGVEVEPIPAPMGGRPLTQGRPLRAARPAAAVMTSRGASRKAWRCV